jgi:hypothetical protein
MGRVVTRLSGPLGLILLAGATGANLHIVNGLNNRESTNGVGNLIVGYKESIASAFGASISGGAGNRARGAYSSVGGGFQRAVVGENNWGAGALIQAQRSPLPWDASIAIRRESTSVRCSPNRAATRKHAFRAHPWTPRKRTGDEPLTAPDATARPARAIVRRRRTSGRRPRPHVPRE